jgi:hypothetical protein
MDEGLKLSSLSDARPAHYGRDSVGMGNRAGMGVVDRHHG